MEQKLSEVNKYLNTLKQKVFFHILGKYYGFYKGIKKHMEEIK